VEKMTKKELYKICHANGVPPLLYKWSFTEEFEDGCLKKKLTPVFGNIESFIRGRNVWYIYMQDSAIGSRLGATFFKAAIISGFMGSRYTTIENIAGYRREDWYEDGDVYSNILNSDFLIVDKVSHKMEEWQRKIWNTFVEDRFLKQKSTIFVGLQNPYKVGVFNERAIDLLNTLEAKVITEEGIK
jgi:hypothetical protein